MVLIRKLTLQGLIHNVRIFAQYMKSKDNYFSDALSRLDFPHFWRLSHQHDMCFEQQPTSIPEDLWPMDKLWME